MSEYGSQVTYSTMCDMVDEIISTERIIRNMARSDRVNRSLWTGEKIAMMRAVSYVVSGGRDGSGRYSAAWEHLRREIEAAPELPVCGAVVLSLRNLMAGMS